MRVATKRGLISGFVELAIVTACVFTIVALPTPVLHVVMGIIAGLATGVALARIAPKVGNRVAFWIYGAPKKSEEQKIGFDTTPHEGTSNKG